MTILNYVENIDRTDMVVDLTVINHVEYRMRRQIEATGAKIHELTPPPDVLKAEPSSPTISAYGTKYSANISIQLKILWIPLK